MTASSPLFIPPAPPNSMPSPGLGLWPDTPLQVVAGGEEMEAAGEDEGSKRSEDEDKNGVEGEEKQEEEGETKNRGEGRGSVASGVGSSLGSLDPGQTSDSTTALADKVAPSADPATSPDAKEETLAVAGECVPSQNQRLNGEQTLASQGQAQSSRVLN